MRQPRDRVHTDRDDARGAARAQARKNASGKTGGTVGNPQSRKKKNGALNRQVPTNRQKHQEKKKRNHKDHGQNMAGGQKSETN